MKHRRDLVRAELAAHPLASKRSFDDAAVELDASAQLLDFGPRAHALGVHRLLSRHSAFAYQDCATVFDVLASSASQHLQTTQGQTVLKAQNAEAVLAWRWMSLALPPSLLVACSWAETSRPDTVWPDSSCIGPTILAPGNPRLQVAHLHQHAGAAAPFEMVWSYQAGNVDPKAIHKSTPAGWKAEQWQVVLAACFLVRRGLFADWCGESTRTISHLSDAQRVLDSPSLAEFFIGRRHRWAKHARLMSGRPPNLRVLSDVWKQDPLAEFSQEDWAEGEFLIQGFERVRRQMLSEVEQRRFLQILRVKTILFRHLTVDVCEEGLGAFTRKYKEMSAYRGDLDTLGVDIGARGSSLQVQAVEVRTSPPDSVGELLDLVSVPGLGAGSPNGEQMMWSWTLHMIRDRKSMCEVDRSPRVGLRARVGVVPQLRHTQLVTKRLCRALRSVPTLLHAIRGLDVASDELKGPMWLCTDYIHTVRRLSEELAEANSDLHPLRVTVHAGEDYGHPVTGLRHVDELRLWDVLRRGDRIGHAISIGADLSLVSSGEPQPRWEALLDAAWLRSAQPWSPIAMDVFDAFLSREAATLGLLREPSLWTELHRTLGAGATPISDTVRELRESFMVASTRDDWHAMVLPSWPPEILDGLATVQRRIVDDLSQLDISIELNPSSNLVIGGLSAPVGQPGWMGTSSLGLSLSADDPLMLSTDIDDEFAYAEAGLQTLTGGGSLAGGVSAAEFLRACAATSVDVTFCQPTGEWSEAPRIAFKRRWRSPVPW